MPRTYTYRAKPERLRLERLAEQLTLPCPGCGSLPANVGTFGRFKFACPLYVGRDVRTADGCIGDILRPSFYEVADAADEWNRMVKAG